MFAVFSLLFLAQLLWWKSCFEFSRTWRWNLCFFKQSLALLPHGKRPWVQFHHLAGALCEVCMGSLQVHQLPHWLISYVLFKLLQVPLTVANNSQTTAHTLQSRCACLAARQHFLLIVCCVVCMFRSTAAPSTLYHRHFDWSHHQQQRWNNNNDYTFVWYMA